MKTFPDKCNLRDLPCRNTKESTSDWNERILDRNSKPKEKKMK